MQSEELLFGSLHNTKLSLYLFFNDAIKFAIPASL